MGVLVKGPWHPDDKTGIFLQEFQEEDLRFYCPSLKINVSSRCIYIKRGGPYRDYLFVIFQKRKQRCARRPVLQEVSTVIRQTLIDKGRTRRPPYRQQLVGRLKTNEKQSLPFAHS